jgi:PAS domain S-box-containing protein
MAMLVDIKTLFIVQTAFFIFLGCFMYLFWLGQKTYKGFVEWMITVILAAVFCLLYTLKGVVPDFASIIVANAGISGVLIFRLKGTKRFFSRPDINPAFWFIPILVLFAELYFYLFDDSPVIRSLFVTIAVVFIMAAIAREFFINLSQDSKYLNIALVILFVIYGGLFLWRGISVLPMKGYTLFSNTILQSVFFLAVPLFETGVNVIFMMLNSQRTQNNLNKVQENLSHTINNLNKKQESLGYTISDLQRFLDEKEKSEMALKESEERYRSLIDLSPDGIVVQRDGKILFINPAALRLFGAGNADDHIGRDILDYIHTDDHAAVTKRLKEFNHGDILPPLEVKCVDVKGNAVNVDISMGKLTFHGKPAIVNILHDISDRKTAERERRKIDEQLQQVQKLESLGVLAGGIAHDFNNLLMAIVGNIDIALMKIPEDSDSVKNLHSAQKACMTASDLCSQMLAYAGKGRIAVRHVNINGLINDMKNMISVSISKRATIQYSLMPDLPDIEADAPQMNQVIMNLLINASEAIGDSNGSIWLRTGFINGRDITKSDLIMSENITETDYVFLEITDSGSGMDARTKEKIFEPFFTTKFMGRGLGLSAILGIVKRQNGVIRLQSSPGEGTSFCLYFPALEQFELETVTEQIETGIKWRGQGTVLLVDDEENIIDVGMKFLESIGFNVMTALNGYDALNIYKENSELIRLVILDLTMPVMNGIETATEMIKIKSDVKIIISSGYSEDVVMKSFEKGTIAGFIQKPYKLQKLVNVISTIMQEPEQEQAIP